MSVENSKSTCVVFASHLSSFSHLNLASGPTTNLYVTKKLSDIVKKGVHISPITYPLFEQRTGGSLCIATELIPSPWLVGPVQQEEEKITVRMKIALDILHK